MDKLLSVFAVLLISAGLTAVAVAVDLPGTDTSDPSQNRYTYNGQVAVGVKDIAGDPIINEDTFSTCVKKDLFSLSFGDSPDALSLTKVKGNEVTWTLRGDNLDTPKTKKDDLGSIARIGGNKVSSVKFSNLNSGTYTQEISVVNNAGSTSWETEVEIGESTAVSSCGGFLS